MASSLFKASGAALVALALAGCGPTPIGDPPLGTGRSGGAGTVGGAGTTAGTTSGSPGGAQGQDQLTGPLAFTPQAAFASGLQTAAATVELTDGYPGCTEDGAYQAVRVTLPGPAALGTFSVDAGAQIEVLSGPPGGLAVVATARSGQVTLNQLDASTLGGNFLGDLQAPDGGLPGTLSGIFSAAICN